MKTYEFLDSKDNVLMTMRTNTPDIDLAFYSSQSSVVRYRVYQTPMPTLEEIKLAKWEEIKLARDTEEQAGLPYMGKVVDSDTLSVQRLTIASQNAQIALALGQDFVIDWTCKDNSVLKMTAKDLIGIPPALAQFSDSLHQKARKLRGQIDEAETIEEVENIKW